MNYSSFYRRFFAFLIDCVITAIGVAVLVFSARLFKAHDSVINSATGRVSGYVIFCLYSALFESSQYQATPGKLLCEIKVVNENGERITFGQAALRSFVKVLTFAISYLFFVVCLFARNKQNIHDIAGKTYVVYKNDSQNPEYAADEAWGFIAIVLIVLRIVSLLFGFAIFSFDALDKIGSWIQNRSSSHSRSYDSTRSLTWQTIDLPEINLSMESPVDFTRDFKEEKRLSSANAYNHATAVYYKPSDESLFARFNSEFQISCRTYTGVSVKDRLDESFYKDKEKGLPDTKFTEIEISGHKAVRIESVSPLKTNFVMIILNERGNEHTELIISTLSNDIYTDWMFEKMINSLKIENIGTADEKTNNQEPKS